ncbi:MAG TPA: hypothetical protein VHF06_36290 [Pseudonocardiaceae bacterium]|jgi:hypothetical protein|nr:hypothetical protein [Pseudonocardiaceae bacterium]
MRALARVVLVAGGVATAAVLGVSQASAADFTYTVAAGSAASGSTVAITGTASGTASAPAITFTDTTTNQVLNCVSATAPATTTVGTDLPGADLATIDGASTTWTNCTGPLGLGFTVTGAGNWDVNGTGETTGGVTPGSITGASASVDDPGVCSFDVNGDVQGDYTNGTSTSTLSVVADGSTLTISNVSGCFGIINDGDSATFEGTYQIAANDSGDNPVTITSNPSA